MMIFEQVFRNINAVTFGAGVVFGVALSIAVYLIGSFIQAHFKQVLIVCAVVTAGSLFMLAW